ncbi:MAG: radical SAM protein [Candidatus Thorarchaeota archaeon]
MWGLTLLSALNCLGLRYTTAANKFFHDLSHFIIMEPYPRMLTPSSTSFDPLELAKATQAMICRVADGARKYTSVYVAGVYGGIATAYAVGCPLRCIFCWVDDSRDYPERRGRFYTPAALVTALWNLVRKGNIRKARISGAEPTLCKAHLLAVLPLIEESGFTSFMLETNGILFGTDPGYVQQVAQFEKVHVRLSLKAATPEGFQQRTGAQGVAVELPFKAVQYLLEAEASFHVAAMTDPRLMSQAERMLLIRRLNEIDVGLAENLEEEQCDPYKATIKRLNAAGVDTRTFFLRPS